MATGRAIWAAGLVFSTGRTRVRMTRSSGMADLALANRGEEYLPGVQLSELEETYRRELPGKSRDRLQAAVLGKRGRTLEKIARVMGRGISTTRR